MVFENNHINDAKAQRIARIVERLENNTLQSLDLAYNQISDTGAQALEKNNTLQLLHLGYNKISGTVLQRIESLLDRNRSLAHNKQQVPAQTSVTLNMHPDATSSPPPMKTPITSPLAAAPPLTRQPSTAPTVAPAPLSSTEKLQVHPHTSATITSRQQKALDNLVTHQAYGALFQAYLDEIYKQPELQAYFEVLQQVLDGTVGGLKNVNSRVVPSTSDKQIVLGLVKEGLSATGSLVGGPAGMSINVVSGVVCRLLSLWDTYEINQLANRVSRLFLNSSDYGHVVLKLAVLFTIHHQKWIKELPENDKRGFLTKTWDSLKAQYDGRAQFTTIDKGVTIHIQKILAFWKSWDESKSAAIQDWFPALLAEFGMILPDSIDLRQLQTSIHAPAPTCRKTHNMSCKLLWHYR